MGTKKDKKIMAGEKNVELEKDSNIQKLIENTTLKDKKLATTAKGQIRNLDTTGVVELDNRWMTDILEIPGAEKKYRNIGINELNFIVNLIKYNNSIIAYKQSYNTEGLTKEYIDQRSRDLKRRADIADLLQIIKERLVRQTETQLQWQFSESVENLKFLIDTAKEEVQNCRDDGKRSYLTLTRVTAIRDAVKELNQMMGYTEKSVKINNSVTIVGNENDLPD